MEMSIIFYRIGEIKADSELVIASFLPWGFIYFIISLPFLFKDSMIP